MSESTGTGTPVVHEAYAFACMRCGYGWEQSYEIEHHTDAHGRAFVVYKAGGERVPSPLSNPTCMNCGGHVVRIMRAGQVSTVLDLIASMEHHGRGGGAKETRPVSPAGPVGQELTEGDETPPVPHHWHLSDLLHPFRSRR
ncbi:hypothetical protein ABZ618_19375 [Streptomyces roseolus]|uniref:hypothetical protein n=1 Tax=Streptomyces roseolus TaxID=67358 RepID=UPI00341066CE